MPGISLEYLCKERAQTTSLEALSNSVLGIEVDHYLRRVIQQSRNPLFTPWAGVSSAFYRTVEHDLLSMEKLGIQPFFVFTGLQVLSQHGNDPNSRLLARVQALNNLERKRNDETTHAFSSFTTPSDLVTAFRHYLRTKSIGFIVAPYFANAQLAYMLHSGLVDAVYAAPDILIFGVERVITDIVYTQGPRATFSDRHIVLGVQLQGLSDDQFLDAYLFAGTEFCPIVPILEANPPAEYSAYRMRAAADVVRQNGTGYLALNGNPVLEKKPRYLEQWLEARALFRHHPYLNRDGDVVLLKQDKAPNDVARVIGARLPRELYFYLSRGLIEPTMLNALLSGTWRETVPLDGGEMREYRYLLDSLNEARVQCIDLLHGSKQLHHYHEKKVVASDRWYQDEHREEIEKLDQPLYHELKRWRANEEFFDKYAEKGSRNLRTLLTILKQPEAVKDSFAADGKIDTKNIQSNVLYRLLQLRGYITPDHTLSEWGTALLVAVEDADDDDSSVTILIVVEMLKLHAIKVEDFSARLMQEAPEVEPFDAQWKIISRIAALLPLQQNDAPWQGPLDKDALISFSLSSTTRRYLSGLYEVIQLSLLLRGDAIRSPGFEDILGALQNPFVKHHDSGMATYAKRYLALLANTSESVKNDAIFDQLKVAFPTSKNGKHDIQALLKLWEALYKAVTSLASNQQMGHVERRKFDRTNDWLAMHL